MSGRLLPLVKRPEVKPRNPGIEIRKGYPELHGNYSQEPKAKSA
jgi:hypothetical protein